MTVVVADATNFPILGEPLPVELANTWYSHATGVIDFLETPTLMASWFDQAPAAAGFASPRRFTGAQSEAVRELRDARCRPSRSWRVATPRAMLTQMTSSVLSQSSLGR